MKQPIILTKSDREAVDQVKALVAEKGLSKITEADIDQVFADKTMEPEIENWIRGVISIGRSDAERIYTNTFTTLQSLDLAGQFTAPTGLLPIIPTFGRAELPEGKRADAGPIDVKRWIFLPETATADESREVQLELPFQDQDAGVEPLERQLRRISDPLGLKVILGTLFFCDRNHRSGWFVYDPNRFCDLMGYARTGKSYHHSTNKRRIEARIQTFLKARYRCEWTGGVKERLPLEMSLLLLDPNSSVKWIIDDVVIRDGKIIYFCGPLYGDIIQNNMYSWVDARFLQLDADKHGRVIQLGTYYSTAWRIDWKHSRGKLHRKLRTILADSGIPLGADQRNLHRTIEAVKRDHEFMAEEGLIKDWHIVEHAGNPLDEIWEVVIPETHGLIVARKPKSVFRDNTWP